MVSPELGRRLRYRSQFVFGPRFVEGLEDWTRFPLARGWCLSAHPDLEVTHVRDARGEITLLGYALDPFAPAATNRDLASRALQEVAGGDLVEFSRRLGGRWILIADDGRGVRLLHDPAGLRQVFYSDVRRTGELWCGSQPGMVAGPLNLPMNQDAVALIAADPRPTREYRLPGELSFYAGVKRLLPNHYLDLTTGTPHRYWPAAPLPVLDFSVAVEKASALLTGLMEGAARRYPLAISITGGRDSRLVLAASRHIVSGVSLVTVAKPGRTEDVTTPARFLPRLGLEHTVIPWPSDVDEDFARLYKLNVPLAHEVYIPEAFAVFAYNHLAKVAVTGSVAEQVRPPRYLSRFGEDDDEMITPVRLAAQAHFGSNPLALETYGAWLAEAPKLGAPPVLDLYRWEGGNWLATTQAEFDTAWRETFTPFNCRLLLETMMAVDRNLRCGPRYRLTEALIRHLWPDLLQEPFLERTPRTPVTPARIGRAVKLAWRQMRRSSISSPQ